MRGSLELPDGKSVEHPMDYADRMLAAERNPPPEIDPQTDTFCLRCATWSKRGGPTCWCLSLGRYRGELMERQERARRKMALREEQSVARREMPLLDSLF